jgi:hypothetical protein
MRKIINGVNSVLAVFEEYERHFDGVTLKAESCRAILLLKAILDGYTAKKNSDKPLV